MTLEQDLERRDLTINAIAKDVETGELIDPFGGERDLRDRMLRHVSNAFVEDPVRVLRAARFAARFAPLGFTVAPETMQLMREIAARGELEALVSERVWQELHKALQMPAPWKFFEVLREAHALPIIFPEIEALFGVPQPEKWHPEIDTGVHTLMVLEQAARLSDDPIVRFAALVHDSAKARRRPMNGRDGRAAILAGDHEVHRPRWRATASTSAAAGLRPLALDEGVPIVVVSISGQETALFLSRGEWLARLLGLDSAFRLKVLPISLAFPWAEHRRHARPLAAAGQITSRRCRHRPGASSARADVDEVYDHLVRLMQETLDALAAERRFPVIG